MMRKLAAAGIGFAMLCACMTGCGKKEIELQNEKSVANYTAPAEGEEIVVIHVKDYGDIKIKLFPELLPEACENFTTLAKEGYYDELIFHRVIAGFMVQGGDPTGTGNGGECCWGGKFDGGYDSSLIHVPGALAYANSAGTATDGSQFYIVSGQNEANVNDAYMDTLVNNGYYFSKEARSYYTEFGGAPHLDGGNYTVFGQVFEGLDIVQQIAAVPTNSSDKPKDAVYMESVTVETYDGSELRWYPSDYRTASAE